MKKSERFVITGLAVTMLAGCISSTTGSPAREADDDDAAEYNYQLGQQYFQNQSYELALDRLQRAIDLDPRSAKSHLMLGMTYDALRRPTGQYVTENNGERLVVRTIYGESRGDAANHRTQVYQIFDGAGIAIGVVLFRLAGAWALKTAGRIIG